MFTLPKADADSRLWIKTLSEFLTNHYPPADDPAPYAVTSARNLALAAAFERIERICRADIDPRPLVPPEV